MTFTEVVGLDDRYLEIVEADMVEDFDGRRVLWEKQDLLRHHPDKHQTGVVWMPLRELGQIRLFPASLGRHVLEALQGDHRSYIGVMD